MEEIMGLKDLINFLILVDYILLFSWKMKFPIYKHIF
jgi:hypothetical protein